MPSVPHTLNNLVTVETLAAFADAWNRHDVDAIMTFMTDDCVFETAAGPQAFGARHVGTAAVRTPSSRHGRTSRMRNGATAPTSSPAIAASPSGCSPGQRPTAAGSRPTASTSSRSAMARSRSRTSSARIARACRLPARAPEASGICSRPALPSMSETTSMEAVVDRRPPILRRRPLRPALRSAGLRTRPRQRYAPTYWVDTAGPPPADDGPVPRGSRRGRGDRRLRLHRAGRGAVPRPGARHQRDRPGGRTGRRGAAPAATAARARTPAAACTARSGSPAGDWRPRSGWTGRSATASRPGRTSSRAGRLRRPGRRPPLHRAPAAEDGVPAARMRSHAGGVRLRQPRMLSSERTPRAHVNDHEAVGALHEKEGIGIHPLKLAYDYLRMAREARRQGPRASPVIGWDHATAPTSCARPAAPCGREPSASPPAATPRRACIRYCAAR